MTYTCLKIEIQYHCRIWNRLFLRSSLLFLFCRRSHCPIISIIIPNFVLLNSFIFALICMWVITFVLASLWARVCECALSSKGELVWQYLFSANTSVCVCGYTYIICIYSNHHPDPDYCHYHCQLTTIELIAYSDM